MIFVENNRPGRARATGAGALALLILVAFGASGCGRRGALEPPPDPSAVAKQRADDDPMHPNVQHKPKPIVAPKQPFLLDPLL